MERTRDFVLTLGVTRSRGLCHIRPEFYKCNLRKESSLNVLSPDFPLFWCVGSVGEGLFKIPGQSLSRKVYLEKY